MSSFDVKISDLSGFSKFDAYVDLWRLLAFFDDFDFWKKIHDEIWRFIASFDEGVNTIHVIWRQMMLNDINILNRRQKSSNISLLSTAWIKYSILKLN